LRPNPNFHPPGAKEGKEPSQILIGAGTGIAGLRAHLLHRQQKRLGDAWLLYGERTRAHDLTYGGDIKAWQEDGTLVRTDLVFSRDAVPKKYVQRLVTEQGTEIGRWIREGGASILVCGGLDMAAGVQQALIAILGEEALDAMTQDGLYRRDIY
jgi:sulfite reductase (NADPH) flavoprotein alpha-component